MYSLGFRVQEVFRRLQAHGLTLSPSKCEFMRTEIDFLGFHLKEGALTTTEKNVEKIRRHVLFAKSEAQSCGIIFSQAYGTVRRYTVFFIPFSCILTSIMII